MSVLVLSESENEDEQLMEELQDEVVVEARPSDERANVPVSVVTERFLRAIVGKVPLDRIEELHLFSPLRQGTVETGIAVVAARVIVVEDAEPIAVLELDLSGQAGALDESEESVALSVEEANETVELLEDERAADVENSVQIERDEAETDEIDGPEFEHHEIDDDSPYADEPVQLKLVASSEYPESDNVDVKAPAQSDREIEVVTAPPAPPRIRHTVYTARYRLIIKGPERGKWEMDVVDEADAPLLAVETVVRGVQRRAGEETATVRYDAVQLARVLRMPIPE